MNLVISGQSVTVTSGVKVIFHVMAGLKKSNVPTKHLQEKLQILKNFTKNEDFYKKPRNNFIFKANPSRNVMFKVKK